MPYSSNDIVNGQYMADFKASTHWANFKELVLDRMDKEAYEGYCSTNPNEIEKTRQFQIIGQIVRSIEYRIDDIIELGKLGMTNLEVNEDE